MDVFHSQPAAHTWKGIGLRFWLHSTAVADVWHAFCTFIQDVQGRYKMVGKGYKVEILIDKMSKREKGLGE